MNEDNLNINKSEYRSKTLFLVGLFFIVSSLTTLTSILSYNSIDPGWGIANGNLPTNYLGVFGSTLSSFIIRELGIFSGIFLSLTILILGIKLIKNRKLNLLFLKFLSLLFLLVLSVIISEIINQNVTKLYGDKFPLFNFQTKGYFLHEIIIKYFENNLQLSLFTSSILINSSLVIVTFLLLIWILSLSYNDLKKITIILKPAILPLYWFLKLTNNLLFKKHQDASIIDELDDIEFEPNRKLSLYNFFQNIFKISNSDRKKTFIKKDPVLIKTRSDTDTILKRKDRTKIRQQNLDLSSETGFHLPPMKLLQIYTNEFKLPDKEVLDSNARLLEGVLNDYSINGKIETVRHGPVVTRYDLKPAPGLRSQRVISLADDIARSMAAESVRVAMVPGQDVIGIELPNKLREKVILRNILESSEFQNTSYKLPICLGKDIAGSPVVADLAIMPHLLVAGTTGSGKSVGINAMIISLLFKHTPETCRFIMIDPKMLELSVYDGIPHLLTPVVTDPNKAIVALKWAVREMESRYLSMSKIGVRNIESYNERLLKSRLSGEVLTKSIQVGFDNETGEPLFEEQEIDLTPLPFIVVVIDEVADLMLVAGKEIEAAVQRLAQMARAAGIHVIMATQRPSVDVITGTIKANFPTRISFQVFSKIDSRTILGEQGAEQLLGKGDMLYMAGGGRIIRVHGPFVEDLEVEKITRFLSNQSQPEYDDSITKEPEEQDNLMTSGLTLNQNNSEDLVYSEAVKLVLRERRASTSFIQRHLRIGYNRAATIIEKMEENNIISKPGRAGKREILIEEGE